MKLLCHVCHYFGPSPDRHAKAYRSHRDDGGARTRYARRTVEALAALAEIGEVSAVDVRVVGYPRHALLPIDLDVSAQPNPRLLVYEALEGLTRHLEDYDYFIAIEDDILLPVQTFRNVLEYDRISPLGECLHPNRVELGDSLRLPLDPMYLERVWTYQEKTFRGRRIRVALNPHSGILVLSRDKLRYALEFVSPAYRGVFLGAAMESAFAHYHKPFSLYRPCDDLDFHVVIHQDRHHLEWEGWARRIRNRRYLRWKLRRVLRGGG